jgi:hypothetical protein
MPRPFLRYYKLTIAAAATPEIFNVPSNTESMAITVEGGNVQMYNATQGATLYWPIATGEKESFDRRAMDTIIGEPITFKADADGTVVRFRMVTKYTV